MDNLGSMEDHEAVIVKADEVDEAGADISTILPIDGSESDFNERIGTRRVQDAQVTGSPKTLANAAASPPRPQPLVRPPLIREGSAPAPPQKPPPAAPVSQTESGPNGADSVSLAQLKQLVAGLPKLESTAYAYDYSETLPFPEELQEWFQYSEQESHTLLQAKHTFIQTWEQAHSERPEPCDEALEWTDVEEEDRVWFIQCAIRALDSTMPVSRLRSLECLSYIALGIWGDTAGKEGDAAMYDALMGTRPKWFESQDVKSQLQLSWMFAGARLLKDNAIVDKLLKILHDFWTFEQSVSRLPPLWRMPRRSSS